MLIRCALEYLYFLHIQGERDRNLKKDPCLWGFISDCLFHNHSLSVVKSQNALGFFINYSVDFSEHLCCALESHIYAIIAKDHK